ncbi:hypothetical protein B0H16DRAFT_1457769 [Mycena metata]|uniref:Uncharacterized protein n=1 Tax=Mycena metata TaxID=1033252 RepID=A0AAD7J5I1_9AGAR|nr:hypothetical protein B0H16DRAFT_1457769 [Mycena metata]
MPFDDNPDKLYTPAHLARFHKHKDYIRFRHPDEPECTADTPPEINGSLASGVDGERVLRSFGGTRRLSVFMNIDKSDCPFFESAESNGNNTGASGQIVKKWRTLYVQRMMPVILYWIEDIPESAVRHT